jgi:hypothetical protein
MATNQLLEAAIDDLKSLKLGEKPNISATARKYGVDRSTLSKRFRGVQRSRAHYDNNQRLLDPQQTKTLIEWINKLTERGLPPSKPILRNFAKELSGREPGKNWVNRFLDTHKDELIQKYATGLDAARSKADSAYRYALYFKQLEENIEKYKIEPWLTYNMDEKGFLMGVLSKQKRIFSKQVYERGQVRQVLQDGSREWITTIACICADGSSLSPSLIYKAVSGKIQSSWLQDYDPEEHSCYIGSSPTGWTTEDFGMSWLRDIFDRETKAKARQKWRLLLLDGHGSHVNMRFINFCEENRILLGIFPPHATHRLQPLDVAVFSPLAAAYSKELGAYMDDCQGFCSLSKRDFFRLFWKAWDTSVSKKNIISSFKATGIAPFDPSVVLKKFEVQDAERPSSSESSKSVLRAEDWRRIRALIREAGTNFDEARARRLNDSLIALSAENILLKSRCEGLERALLNERKKKIPSKPLLQDIQSKQSGGAIFWSPNKIHQAREREAEKEEKARQKRLQKEQKKALQEERRAEKREVQQKRLLAKEKVASSKSPLTAKKRQQAGAKLATKLASLALQNSKNSVARSPDRSPAKIASPKLVLDEEYDLALLLSPTGKTRAGRRPRPSRRVRENLNI